MKRPIAVFRRADVVLPLHRLGLERQALSEQRLKSVDILDIVTGDTAADEIGTPSTCSLL